MMFVRDVGRKTVKGEGEEIGRNAELQMGLVVTAPHFRRES